MFVCTFTTRSGDTSVWVRAWTAEQARELVDAQLREKGLATLGDVRVAPLGAAHTVDLRPV